MLQEHDGVIDTAKNLAQLLNKEALSEEETENAVKAARELLVHVSNCDELAILTERLNEDEIRQLSEKFSAARDAGVPLLEWADKIREK
ncbi:MAG: hypothetical protein ACE5PV_10285 [Candidatus Poribacteria bacterium]